MFARDSACSGKPGNLAAVWLAKKMFMFLSGGGLGRGGGSWRAGGGSAIADVLQASLPLGGGRLGNGRHVREFLGGPAEERPTRIT